MAWRPRVNYSYHKKAREQALAVYRPGTLCVRCGHPTWYPRDQIDLDHRDDGRGYLGWSHHSPCRTCGARCNQAAGGRKGALLAGKTLRAGGRRRAARHG